jgi:5-methylcytosine-specific restriction enzyme subunit McrC
MSFIHHSSFILHPYLMSHTVTLFEHEYTDGFGWTGREYAALESLRRAAGAEVLRATVRGGRRELQAAQYVGVVRLGARTVQVLPKIYRARAARDDKERATEATRNLLYLLAYAGRLPVREHELAALLRAGADWFEILTRLFATHLRAEWQRGAHRHYQTVEDELPVLKGQWRIAAQLRHPLRRHVFSVAYDEFTADNALNRVFRFVVERLWHWTRDGGNRRLLGELREWLDEVTLVPRLTAAAAAPALLTRLSQRFTPLLNLARLFLSGGALQLAAGDLDTFAFVFDMNQLFESFIINFIRRHRAEVLPPTLAACDLLAQTRGATRYLAHDARGHEVFQLKPDLAFQQAGTFPLLLDAKYKRLDPADRRLGIAPADIYQIHAYAYRYDCPRILLLYPQTADMPAPLRAHFTLKDGRKMISAATVNLRVDLSTMQARRELMNELQDLLAQTTLQGEHDADTDSY